MNDTQRKQRLIAARELELSEATAEEKDDAAKYGMPGTITLWNMLTMNGYEQAAVGLLCDLLHRLDCQTTCRPDWWSGMAEFYREEIRGMLGGVSEEYVVGLVATYRKGRQAVSDEVMPRIESLRKPDEGDFGF